MAYRRWVVNASPLILLGKVEQLRLLGALAEQVTSCDYAPLGTPCRQTRIRRKLVQKSLTITFVV